MKKFILSVAGALALSSSLSAAVRLEAKVPFAFEAGGETMPAGDYVITENGTNGVLTVAGAKRTVLVLRKGFVDGKVTSDNVLEFERKDGKVYLKAVLPAGLQGSELPSAK